MVNGRTQCPLTSPCLCCARLPSASNSLSTSFTFRLQSGSRDTQVTQGYMVHTSPSPVRDHFHPTFLRYHVHKQDDYTMNIALSGGKNDVHALFAKNRLWLTAASSRYEKP